MRQHAASIPHNTAPSGMRTFFVIWFGQLVSTVGSGLTGFALVNLAFGFQNVLFAPLILSFTTPAVMGAILSVGGAGLLAGSLLMSTWGGTKNKIYGLMGGLFFLGIFAGLTGLRPDPLLIAAANVGMFSLTPIVNGSSQAIWQAKVAPDVQGRVFATRRLLALVALPISYLAAGPLADLVFEPLMAKGGAWAAALGPIPAQVPAAGSAWCSYWSAAWWRFWPLLEPSTHASATSRRSCQTMPWPNRRAHGTTCLADLTGANSIASPLPPSRTRCRPPS